MSKEVDQRIVQMQFDNKKFEQGISTTLNSLNRLDTSLNKLNDISLKGFEKIGQFTSKLDFGILGDAADAVSSRMSSMGIVGATVLQNLTNAAINTAKHLGNITIGQIMTGGKNRALNIEAAKFQLEGLGVAWDKIKDDINYGVKDTAYGLDAAAKAASQLVASQVQLGDEMRASLRGISGVAAMTNSSYEDISNIFTTVAGNGRLYAQQLMQFSSRGLNAAATLGKALGKSEAEIREMVSKGKIDFKTFAKAMDDAFGEHAKDANKTFTGALSNMKAALSRVGAEFYTPGLQYARDIFNSITSAVDRFKATLADHKIFSDVSEIMSLISKHTVDFFSALGDDKGTLEKFIGKGLTKLHSGLEEVKKILTTGAVTGFLSSISHIASVVGNSIKMVVKGISEIIPINLNARFIYLSQILKEIADYFNEHIWFYQSVKDIAIGIASAFKIVYSYVSAAFKITKDYLGAFFGNKIREIIEWFGKLGKKIKEFSEQQDPYTKWYNSLQELIPKITQIREQINKSIERINKRFKDNFGKTIPELIDSLKEKIHNLFFGEKDPDRKQIDWFNLLSIAIEGITRALETLIDIFGAFYDGLGGNKVFDAFSTNLGKIVDKINGVKGFKDGDNSFVENLSPGLRTFLIDMRDVFDNLKKMAADAWVSMKPIYDGIIDFLKTATFGDLAKAAATGGGLFLFKKIWDDLVIMFPKLRRLNPLYRWDVTLGTTINNLNGVFLALQSGIENFAKQKSAETLKTVAVAVALLAGSLFVLSTLDEERLAKGLSSISILIAELYGMLYGITQLAGTLNIKKSLNLAELVAGIIGIGIAVALLAGSLRTIAKIDPERLGAAFRTLTAIFIELGAAVYLISKYDVKIEKIGLSLIGIAFAIRVLASAVKVLGNMEGGDLAKGLVGLIVSMGAIFAFVFGIKALKIGESDLMGVAVSLIVIGISMNVIAKAVKALGKLKPEQLISGLLGFLAMLAFIFAFVAALKAVKVDAKNLVAVAAGLIVFGVAFNVMALAIKQLGSMKPEELIAGLLAFLATLAFVFAFVAALSAMEVGGLGMIGIAAALILMGVAINTLVQPLKEFGSMEHPIKALLVLAGALLILAGAAALFGFVPELAIGLALLAAGILSIGAGVALLGVGILALGAGINLIVEAFRTLVKTILEVGEGLIQVAILLAESIVAFLTTIGEHKEELIEGVEALIEIVCTAIMRGTDTIILAIFGLITSLFRAMRDNIPEWGRDVVDIVLGLLDQLIKGLTDNVPKLAEDLYDFCMTLLDELVKLMKRAPIDLIDIMFGDYNSDKSKQDKAEEYGGNVAKDFVKGAAKVLSSSATSGLIYRKTGAIGYAMNTGLRAAIRSNSPSKESMDIARDYVLGLTTGLSKYSSDVSDSAGEIGTDLNNGLTSSLSGSLLGADFNPTITPVLDMSDVNSGFATLDGMFSQSRSIALAGDVMGLDSANRNLSLQIQNDNSSNMTNGLAGLRSDINRLGDAMMNTQMVMDTGEVVGVMASPMDRELGRRAIQVKRGGARR